MPGCDCVLGKPDRQAPALAQGGIVFGPVRDPAPLFRDAVTASSIGLERHRGSRVIGGVVHLRQPPLHANRPIRATNSCATTTTDLAKAKVSCSGSWVEGLALGLWSTPGRFRNQRGSHPRAE